MNEILNKTDLQTKADVCLILEGSYPYVQGGVSSWVQNLILSHRELTFWIVAIIPLNYNESYKYQPPSNLLGVYNLRIQKIHDGKKNVCKTKQNEIIDKIKKCLLGIYIDKDINYFDQLLKYLKQEKAIIGKNLLFSSTVSWEIIKDMYVKTLNNSSFLDYFWSWRILFGGLFSILFSELPKASCYHAISTGYAGIYLAKAHFETNRPCMITEHGIYTNERRIEISTASWLYSQSPFSLSIANTHRTSGLQEMWSEIFSVYSKFTYESSKYITTLFEGNRKLQIADGAEYSKTSIIPNGINYDKFSSIPRKQHVRPTVALIGRVVQIKDIKTYIQSLAILKKNIPDIVGYLIGSQDEEPLYAKECFELVKYLGLDNTIVFTGNQDISDYLGKIDILVLTSLSEAQPLVILEGGAAGIPSIATDVGSCRELIEGTEDEHPKLGDGGIVVPLSNHEEIAASMLTLLTNKEFYDECSRVMKQRVKTYYTSDLQHERYQKIYDDMISLNGAE